MQSRRRNCISPWMTLQGELQVVMMLKTSPSAERQLALSVIQGKSVLFRNSVLSLAGLYHVV